MVWLHLGLKQNMFTSARPPNLMFCPLLAKLVLVFPRQAKFSCEITSATMITLSNFSYYVHFAFKCLATLPQIIAAFILGKKKWKKKHKTCPAFFTELKMWNLPFVSLHRWILKHFLCYVWLSQFSLDILHDHIKNFLTESLLVRNGFAA